MWSHFRRGHERLIVATKPGAAISWRRRRWSRLETVAWIVFRRAEAVKLAATLESERPQRSGAKTDPLLRLAVIAAVPNPKRDLIVSVAKADRMLRDAETTEKLRADRNGRYDSIKARRLFPSAEGRGRGRTKKLHASDPKKKALGIFFLTTRPDDDSPLRQAFDWCKARGLASKYERYTPLREEALFWAEKELAARERALVGIARADRPSAEEFAGARANLALWIKLSGASRS